MFQTLQEWFLGLGAQYGVNPVVFGIIYVGAIPFFTASLAWLVRNQRAGKPIVVPALSTSFCFISAYLYLAIVGKNIPVWVYIFVAGMVAFGVYSTIRKVRGKLGGATESN
jgi:hypothetical protein